MPFQSPAMRNLEQTTVIRMLNWLITCVFFQLDHTLTLIMICLLDFHHGDKCTITPVLCAFPGYGKACRTISTMSRIPMNCLTCFDGSRTFMLFISYSFMIRMDSVRRDRKYKNYIFWIKLLHHPEKLPKHTHYHCTHFYCCVWHFVCVFSEKWPFTTHREVGRRNSATWCRILLQHTHLASWILIEMR